MPSSRAQSARRWGQGDTLYARRLNESVDMLNRIARDVDARGLQYKPIGRGGGVQIFDVEITGWNDAYTGFPARTHFYGKRVNPDGTYIDPEPVPIYVRTYPNLLADLKWCFPQPGIPGVRNGDNYNILVWQRTTNMTGEPPSPDWWAVDAFFFSCESAGVVQIPSGGPITAPPSGGPTEGDPSRVLPAGTGGVPQITEGDLADMEDRITRNTGGRSCCGD